MDQNKAFNAMRTIRKKFAELDVEDQLYILAKLQADHEREADKPGASS